MVDPKGAALHYMPWTSHTMCGLVWWVSGRETTPAHTHAMVWWVSGREWFQKLFAPTTGSSKHMQFLDTGSETKRNQLAFAWHVSHGE